MLPPTTRPHPGDLLDHYQLQSLVSSSTRTDVFRAIDTRTHKTVAIKIPHLEIEGDSTSQDRFYREEEIETKLDHPGIMKIFPNPNRSQVYIVMEWLEGKLLRQILIEETPLPADRTTKLVVGVCDAFEYIHNRGIFLRDLKPESIMVDSENRIKLFDFGFAALVGARRLTFANLSASLGTPDYISPEQVQGKHGNARSDIYSLGAILYEMLTGAVPFPGTNPFEVMNKRLQSNPIPPTQINSAITPQMQEIIYRALERDPINRYASAREFAHDLRHPEQVGISVRSRPSGQKAFTAKWRSRGLVYLAIALLPLLIFVLLIFVSRHH